MKPTIYFISMLLACAMISCTSKGQNASGDSIVFDSIIVNQKVLLFPDKTDSVPYINIFVNFKFPVAFNNEEDVKKLQKLFIQTTFDDSISETPQEAVEKHIAAVSKRYRDDYKNDYLESLQEDTFDEFPMYIYMHVDEINNTIEHTSPSFISISNHTYQNFGGAHPAYFLTNRSIDLINLALMTEESLYAPGYENQLTKIIQAGLIDYVREQSDDYEENDDNLKQYFFDFDAIKPNNNFYCNDDGLTYVYNSYEIAPYASGMFEVQIPYSKVEGLLKPDAIRNFFPNVDAPKQASNKKKAPDAADKFPAFLSKFLTDCWWDKNFNTLLRDGDQTLAKYIDPKMDIRRYYSPGALAYLYTRADNFGLGDYNDFDTKSDYAGEYSLQLLDADFEPCSFDFDFAESGQLYYRPANDVPDVIINTETFETAPVELPYPDAAIMVVYLPDTFNNPRAFYFIETSSGWKLAFVDDSLCSA